MASPIRGAMDRTRIFSWCLCFGSGTVSVMTISEISGISARFMAALPGKTPCGGGYEDVTSAVFSEALRGGGHGTAGGDFVVDEDGVAAVYFTDDVVSFDAVVVSGASFLDDG